MKRLFLILLILIWPVFVSAQCLELAMVQGDPEMVDDTAAPPAGCSAGSNEIGDRTEYAEGYTLAGTGGFCLLYTADCTGTLAYPYIYHYGTQADNAKVCAYSDDGDSIPNVGDLLLGCSGVIASGSSAGWKTDSTDLTDAVTVASPYWVCIVPDPATQWASLRTSSGSGTQYYQSGFSYASPPANLDGSWSSTALRDYSLYIEIE